MVMLCNLKCNKINAAGNITHQAVSRGSWRCRPTCLRLLRLHSGQIVCDFCRSWTCQWFLESGLSYPIDGKLYMLMCKQIYVYKWFFFIHPLNSIWSYTQVLSILGFYRQTLSLTLSFCDCVCVCVCLCVVYVFLWAVHIEYVCVHAWVCVYVCQHLSLSRSRMRAHAHMHAHKHICVHTRAHTHMFSGKSSWWLVTILLTTKHF